MKYRELIFLAFKNSLRYKKRNIMIFLLMLVAETMVIFSVSLTSSLTDFTNKTVINNVDGRSIFVAYDYKMGEASAIAKIKKVNHIVAAVPQSSLYAGGICSLLAGKTNGNDGNIELHGGNPLAAPEVVGGRGFKEGETNVGIIPRYFYPDTRLYKIKDPRNPLDGRAYIGSKLTIKQGGGSYTFTVIGVYDSEECGQSMNTVFVPFSDIYAINQASKPDDGENHSRLFAVVDQYSHMNSVMNEISRNGMNPGLKITMNTHFAIFIYIIAFLLSGIVVLITFFSILFSTLNSIKERTQEIGLMKAIGFTGRNVILLLNAEMLEIGLLCFLLSCVTGSAAVEIMVQSSGGSDTSVPVKLYFISFLFTFLISVLTPILGTLGAGLRSIHIQPSSAMKE